MSQRRIIENGRVMLITTCTQDRKPIFENEANALEAIETLYRVQQLHPFFLFGFCVMPDHVHILLHVPEPQKISKIMNVWKAGVTRNIGIKGRLWQPRYYMSITRKFGIALEYVHANPVKKNLAMNPEDYPWSSACGRWDVSPIDVLFDNHYVVARNGMEIFKHRGRERHGNI